MQSTRLSRVRWRSGTALAFWVQLKWEVFNGLQSSARGMFLWTLTTDGLLSHTKADIGNPCSKLQTYPKLNSTNDSQVQKLNVWVLLTSAHKAWKNIKTYLSFQLLFPWTLKPAFLKMLRSNAIWSSPQGVQNSYSALLSSSHKMEEVLESSFSPKRSDKIRLNITSSSRCQHRMWTVMQTVQDISGICRKSSKKNEKGVIMQKELSFKHPKLKAWVKIKTNLTCTEKENEDIKGLLHDCKGNEGKHWPQQQHGRYLKAKGRYCFRLHKEKNVTNPREQRQHTWEAKGHRYGNYCVTQPQNLKDLYPSFLNTD